VAVLRFEDDELDVPDGERILEYAEQLGVPFGCQDGVCGTCRCRVISGIEYLGTRNDKEEDMDLDPDERLVCQCVISGGEVEIEIE
jgi:ferredoxin